MPARTRKRIKTASKHTSSLLITIFVLLFVGLLLVYDSTMFYSQDVYGSPYKFAFLQLAWVGLGLLGFFVFFKVHYKKWLKLSAFFFIATLVFLAILAFFGLITFQFKFIECFANMPFVPCINGAYRWFLINSAPFPEIPFIGVLSFQPAELAKFSMVLYLAALLSKYEDFRYFLFPAGLVFGLILLQPNMSTASLIFLISLSIYFASGAPLKPLFILGPVFALLLFSAIMLSPYRRDRFVTLIKGSSTREESLSTGYHKRQILISLGSGGWFGLGIGQSRQKYQYLPEVAADSIFAILGEEVGFIGAALFVVGFSYLVYQGYRIGIEAPDTFSRLLAVGVTSWLGLQFLINVAAMTQLIPLTGIPIPLVSYGGSSMIFTLCGLGILANVSRYSG
ncbi:hypothetical protein GF360_02615 [candidate division WWE3 bacterium]|nr:hypothetical protein [candidate division WWE3 bacterium]